MTPMTQENIDIQARKLSSEVFLRFLDRGERSRKMETGFYTEFRCASHEHSGLLWGAIFEKKYLKSRNPYFLKISMS